MPQDGPQDIREVVARCAAQRRDMIRTQIVARGVREPAIIEALQAVPREFFVPPELQDRSYDDSALPLGPGQTISQPYIVAYMTHQLECTPRSRVLEIGTGSGYQACVLGRLVAEVHTVEWDAALSAEATHRAAALGLYNVHTHVGDGSMGWPEAAPYDRILVTAACPEAPAPLLDQLALGGVAVLPVGPGDSQVLTRIVRAVDGLHQQRLIGCRFVKLLGRFGHGC